MEAKKDGIVYLELSIKAINYLCVTGFIVVPVTIAYSNKTFRDNIDPTPTRFLCHYSFTYKSEMEQTQKLQAFSDAINQSGLSQFDVKK